MFSWLARNVGLLYIDDMITVLTKVCKENLTNHLNRVDSVIKGMEHVPNLFMSFDKYLFLEVINILI